MKSFFCSILLLSFVFFAEAQIDKNQALAKQYYQTGDYEKAADLFEDLFKQESNNSYYYSSLLNCYIKLTDFTSAEKLVKKQIKKHKDNLLYSIDLGNVYSQNNDAKAAENTFNDVINQLTPNMGEIRNVANKFIGLRQNEYAIEAYLKGRSLFKDPSLFGFELGSVYLRENDAKEAVATYLNLIKQNEQYKKTVQSILSNYLSDEDIQEELETQLYTQIQKNASKIEFSEMLIWLYTHQGDYEQALIQAKAIDKRRDENGSRIIKLANNALQQKQYDAAISAYQYVQSKGSSLENYQLAKSLEIKATNLKITNTSSFTKEELSMLEDKYISYLNTYGKTAENISSMRELADLKAYFLHNLDTAILILEELIQMPNLSKKVKNEVKLDLGDYYVLAGDVWEATLYYAQVDKDEKDSPLGEDARFRNARLSYYKGEFEWAQAQLNILKGATTELIANDALELSIFIQDNLGLDTTTTTLQMYADADLLHWQNKDAEALKKIDDLMSKFPGHSLTDDVLMLKAEIAIENKDYEEAITLLNNVLTNHGEDILADNATFMLGDIYQNYLNNNDKAMEFYKKIITDYSDSVLLVEARKRFRFLRGDDV